MNKRDYLRSLGFRVGERGRFTDAMHTAIRKAEEEGMKFDEKVVVVKKQPTIIKREKIRAHIPEQRVIREARELFGYTAEGYKVGFILCSNCNQHMIYCDCSGVFAPSMVKSSDDPLVRIKE